MPNLPCFPLMGRKDIQKKHVKVIILDLWATWLTDKNMYISYHRGNHNYKGKSRYNELHISFKAYDASSGVILDKLSSCFPSKQSGPFE